MEDLKPVIELMLVILIGVFTGATTIIIGVLACKLIEKLTKQK